MIESQAQHYVNGDRWSLWDVASFDPLQNESPGTSCWRYYHRWWRLWDNSLCQIWCRSSLIVLWQCVKLLLTFKQYHLLWYCQLLNASLTACCRYQRREVVAIYLQILSTDTSLQYGSWSAADHSHMLMIWQDPIRVCLHDTGLDLSGSS